jgi:hypothetical protein
MSYTFLPFALCLLPFDFSSPGSYSLSESCDTGATSVFEKKLMKE